MACRTEDFRYGAPPAKRASETPRDTLPALSVAARRLLVDVAELTLRAPRGWVAPHVLPGPWRFSVSLDAPAWAARRPRWFTANPARRREPASGQASQPHCRVVTHPSGERDCGGHRVTTGGINNPTGYPQRRRAAADPDERQHLGGLRVGCCLPAAHDHRRWHEPDGLRPGPCLAHDGQQHELLPA